MNESMTEDGTPQPLLYSVHLSKGSDGSIPEHFFWKERKTLEEGWRGAPVQAHAHRLSDELSSEIF